MCIRSIPEMVKRSRREDLHYLNQIMAEYGQLPEGMLEEQRKAKKKAEASQRRAYAEKFALSPKLKVIDGLETGCQVSITSNKKEIGAAIYSFTGDIKILRQCRTCEASIEEVRAGKMVLFKLTFPDTKVYLCEAKERFYRELLVESMKSPNSEPELPPMETKIVNMIGSFIAISIFGVLLFGLYKCSSYRPPVLTAEQKEFKEKKEQCWTIAHFDTKENGSPAYRYAEAVSPDYAVLNFQHPTSGRTWQTKYVCDL